MPKPQAAIPRWAKLWVLVVVVAMTTGFACLWAAHRVRALPETTTALQLALATYYGAITVLALAIAFLVDEGMFQGGFRRTTLGGEQVPAKRALGEGNIARSAALFQRNQLSFVMTFALAWGACYVGAEMLTGFFSREYQRVGRHVFALWRGEATAKREAVASLFMRRETAAVQTLLDYANAQPTDQTRTLQAVLWALGSMHDLPSRRPLLHALGPYTDASIPTELRREALIGLGRLRDPHVTPHLAALAQDDATHDRFDARVIYALGLVASEPALAPLQDALMRGPSKVQQLAAWGLSQHTAFGTHTREVAATLGTRLLTADAPLGCAIAWSLGQLGVEDSNLALQKSLDGIARTHWDAPCPGVSVALGVEGMPAHPHHVIELPQSLVVTHLLSMARVRATDPTIRAHVEPWLAALAHDKTLRSDTTFAASSLLDAIRTGRDDTAYPTLDEALKK